MVTPVARWLSALPLLQTVFSFFALFLAVIPVRRNRRSREVGALDKSCRVVLCKSSADSGTERRTKASRRLSRIGERVILEKVLPGFQPRRDYRAKLKSRTGTPANQLSRTGWPHSRFRFMPFSSFSRCLRFLFVGQAYLTDEFYQGTCLSVFPARFLEWLVQLASCICWLF